MDYGLVPFSLPTSTDTLLLYGMHFSHQNKLRYFSGKMAPFLELSMRC